MKSGKRPKKNATVAEPVLAHAQAVHSLSAESLLNITRSQTEEPLSRIHTFRKGLKKRSLDHLKEVTGLDHQTLAFALSVSTKTLQRTEVFDVVQSEKMYELADLYATGISYFGVEGFRRWMDRPLFTLGNHRPLDLLDVSEGIDMLRTEIMRMQHGVAV